MYIYFVVRSYKSLKAINKKRKKKFGSTQALAFTIL